MLVLFAVFVGAVAGDSDHPRTSVVAGADGVPAVVGVGIVAAVAVVAAAFVMRECRRGIAVAVFG